MPTLTVCPLTNTILYVRSANQTNRYKQSDVCVTNLASVLRPTSYELREVCWAPPTLLPAVTICPLTSLFAGGCCKASKDGATSVSHNHTVSGFTTHKFIISPVLA